MRGKGREGKGRQGRADEGGRKGEREEGKREGERRDRGRRRKENGDRPPTIFGLKVALVSVSVTFVDSVETGNHIVRRFSPYSFSVTNGMAILGRGPPNGGIKCKGYEKNHDF